MTFDLKVLILIISFLLLPQTSFPEDICPNGEVFSDKLITDINWGTIFPIKVFGGFFGDGDRDDIPDGSSDASPIVCSCYKGDSKIPDLGTPISMWEPSFLIETVRIEYCSPVMEGKLIQESYKSVGGPQQTDDAYQQNFYEYHFWSFPLLFMLEMFVEQDCMSDWYTDIDLTYMSEVDPTWRDDELALFTNYEAALFSSPAALALCLADSAAGMLGETIPELYGCAGTWGLLYPFTGYILTPANPPRDSSLASAKALAALHRRGLARRTMGEEALCRKPFEPLFLKDQYRMSMFFPVAEVEATVDMGGSGVNVKGSHVIGESTYLWGEWRNIPATGEDFIYVLWRWNDCCMRDI